MSKGAGEGESKKDWRENYERFIADAIKDPDLIRRFYRNPEEVAKGYNLKENEASVLKVIANQAKDMVDQSLTSKNIGKIDEILKPKQSYSCLYDPKGCIPPGT